MRCCCTPLAVLTSCGMKRTGLHWVITFMRKIFVASCHGEARARSLRLANTIPDAITPPRLNITEVAFLLGAARATIGVDTGLNHLSAALNVPTIGIYTATDPALTGLYAGAQAINLGSIGCVPNVTAVFDALEKITPC
jgi:ADP-heptose:LPS heptosyltransferase